MTPAELAAELGISAKSLRAWLRTGWPRETPGSGWSLTEEQVQAARERWSAAAAPATAAASPALARPAATAARRTARDSSDEGYVIDLLDDLLGEPARRQHRFPWLSGDVSSTGRAALLPVDAYWPGRQLVVEYRERQHDEATPFFDKPDRLTVSGVHRGEQRRIYDERREALIPAHGLTLLIVRPDHLAADRRGRLLRDRARDSVALRALLAELGRA